MRLNNYKDAQKHSRGMEYNHKSSKTTTKRWEATTKRNQPATNRRGTTTRGYKTTTKRRSTTNDAAVPVCHLCKMLEVLFKSVEIIQKQQHCKMMMCWVISEKWRLITCVCFVLCNSWLLLMYLLSFSHFIISAMLLWYYSRTQGVMFYHFTASTSPCITKQPIRCWHPSDQVACQTPLGVTVIAAGFVP